MCTQEEGGRNLGATFDSCLLQRLCESRVWKAWRPFLCLQALKSDELWLEAVF